MAILCVLIVLYLLIGLYVVGVGFGEFVWYALLNEPIAGIISCFLFLVLVPLWPVLLYIARKR